MEEARRAWAKCIDWRTAAAKHFSNGQPPSRFFSWEWTLAVGHIALLDGYAKLVHLGLLPKERPQLFLSPSTTVPNLALLKCWESHVQIITKPKTATELHPAAEFPEISMNALRLTDGRTLGMYQEACAVASEAWDAQERGPLLQLDEEQRRRGWKCLKDMGLPKDAWFVALHVREAGFYNERRDSRRNSLRNSDIDSYLPAIESITRRGGWLLRIGDASMKPLPTLERVVDYALSRFKSDWMDVFLMAECRFYLGTNSGPAMVPPPFGVPCVFANWLPLSLLPYQKKGLFIPKLYRLEPEERFLHYDEVIALPMRFSSHPDFLARHGISIRDNTSDEIKEVVDEMMEELEGATAPAPETVARRAAFATIVQRYCSHPGPRLGRAFINEYPQLLENPATPFGINL